MEKPMAGKKGRSGRPPKPTEQHKLDGTFRPDRHANRADSDPANGWPTMPAGLSPMQQSLWDDVTSYLPANCLGKIDTTTIRDLIRWYGVYADSMGLLEQDPTDTGAMKATTAAWDRFWRIAQEYGLSPVARARLVVPKSGTGDVLDPLKRLMESRN